MAGPASRACSPRCGLILGLGLVVALLSLPAPARALGISSPNLFTDNRPTSDSLPGYYLNLFVCVDEPGGAANVTSVAAIPERPGLPTITLGLFAAVFCPPPLLSYTTIVPYSGQTGRYLFQVTNRQGQTASIFSHDLDKPQRIPTPTGIVTSDLSTEPTVSFVLPAGANSGRVSILDVVTSAGLFLPASRFASPGERLTYTVPAGVLTVGRTVRVRAEAWDQDLTEPSDQPVNRIENRGYESFLFTPTSPPGTPPPGLGPFLIGPPLPAPNFTPAFFESQLTALNDQYVAAGGRPLTPTDCPEGRCAGAPAVETGSSYLFDLFYAQPRLRDVRAQADALVFQMHLPDCGPVPEPPCFDRGQFEQIRQDLGRTRGQVTEAGVRRVIGDAAQGSKLTATTILQRPEQAAREAVRGLFLDRVFRLTSAELTETKKAQIRALAGLPDPTVVLPNPFTVTYSPVATGQFGSVVDILGLDTGLGPFAVLGFAMIAQLDQSMLEFLQVQVGDTGQASFGVLGTGFAALVAEVTGLLPDRRVELTVRGTTPAPFFEVERARVGVTLSAAAVRGGEPLTIGVEVRNPAGNVEADLYVGALLPDGQTAMFFTGPGVPGTPVSLGSPAQFPRMQAAPLGYSLSAPAFFQFTFPAAGGVAPGVYKVFGALVRKGAFADNRMDPDDLLAVDLKALTYGP